MMPWMDFSGAPAMLIPARVSKAWSGVGDEDWGDYNRACEIAWPRKGVIEIADSSGFVFYSESDTHTWIAQKHLYASGGWIPSDSELKRAQWESGVIWLANERRYLLVNAAQDLRQGVSGVEHISIELEPASYFVDYVELWGEYCGQFHRLRVESEV